MALKIPKDEIPVIATIARLPEASVDELITALSEAPELADSDKMAETIAGRVPSIASDKLAPILDTLYSLYHIREFSGVKPAQFLEDLIDGMHEGNHPELADSDIGQLKVRFSKLISIDKVKVISKATRLQRDGERLYCNAKILSDIRPVFSEDPSLRPEGAVVTHTLKIAYHDEGGDHREFHVVLDSADIEALNDVIDRADKKDQTLRKLLKESNLSDLGL